MNTLVAAILGLVIGIFGTWTFVKTSPPLLTWSNSLYRSVRGTRTAVIGLQHFLNCDNVNPVASQAAFG